MQQNKEMFTTEELQQCRYILIQHLSIIGDLLQKVKDGETLPQNIPLLHQTYQMTSELLTRVDGFLGSAPPTEKAYFTETSLEEKLESA